MGDRPGNSSRAHASEDKVCRKHMCLALEHVEDLATGDVEEVFDVEEVGSEEVVMDGLHLDVDEPLP